MALPLLFVYFDETTGETDRFPKKELLSRENDGKKNIPSSYFQHCDKKRAAAFAYIDKILFCGRIKTNQILADIISDEWPESLYHDALVMTIGKVSFSP